MNSDWKSVKLTEIASKKRWALNGGPFGSKLSRKHYSHDGVPVIRGCNLPANAKFSFEDFVYVSEEKADELIANNAHPGDLVFTQRGTIGQIGLIPQDSPFRRFVISQSQMKLTVNSELADPSYLYHLFSSPAVVQSIHNLAFAAGVPHINLEILRNFQVDLPPLPIQRRIAGILSAYDDLIEKSQRRIKILEEMARRLYREWFVHFRFPGHEDCTFVDSPLGEIPEGWNVEPLGKIANITMGLSPKGDSYNEEAIGTPLVNGPVEFGERFARRIKWTTSPTKICSNGDLIICVRGSTTGKYVKSDGEYCLGRGVCSLASDFQGFTDQLFISELPVLLRQTSGSTFPSWTSHQLMNYQAIHPPLCVLTEFEEIVRPINEQIFTADRQIQNLRRTRDLLLPRLLSGQVDVEALPEPGRNAIEALE